MQKVQPAEEAPVGGVIIVRYLRGLLSKRVTSKGVPYSFCFKYKLDKLMLADFLVHCSMNLE